MGFAVTSLFGTLLHFLYEWSSCSVFLAPFSGVNESTWEHMKLLFWPMFLYALFENFFYRASKDFWCIKLKGILLGLSLIPIIFYTYNGVVGRSPDWINITIFFVAAAVSYIYESKQFKNRDGSYKSCKIAFILIFAIGVLFVIFTFYTPKIGIFKDPITEGYGINTSNCKKTSLFIY